MASPAADLKQKIKLILSQVLVNTPIYTYLNPNSLALRQASTKEDPPIIEATGDVEIAHEQLVALRTLYVQCAPDLQKQFAGMLMAASSATNAAIVVHAMIDVGALRSLVNALKEAKAVDAAK